MRDSSSGRARRFLLAATLLAVLNGIASPAVASDESERLYSRGLVDFHAGRYAAALELFDRAVAADPLDAYALYYRGVTQARLDNLRAAVVDLKAALAQNSALDQATIDLGVALVKLGEPQEALPWLEKARQLPAAAAQADLFLGIAQLRLERFAAARESLTAAGRDPTLRTSAEYYLGIVEYRLRDFQKADEHFSRVVESDPQSAMGMEAAEFLAGIRSEESRPYLVYGELGFQYDSNVAVAPDDNVIKADAGISDQSDGRVAMSAGGLYVPWRTKRAQLLLGYELYQSLHFDLQKFDLQNHRPTIQLMTNTDLAQIGIALRYDYYLLQTSSFLQQAEALPWVTIPEGDLGRTELFYRFRWRGFYPEPFESLRDVYNHTIGGRQLFYIGAPERFVFVGYRYDHDDPVNSAGSQFEYDGHEPSAGIGWELPFDSSAEVYYAFRHENFVGKRDDNEHRIAIALEKGIVDHLSVVLGYFGAFNDSDLAPFTYDRSIASLALRAEF